MCPKRRSLLILWVVLVGSLFSSQTHAFIHREYTIHEILGACTNIVFGKVSSVDAERLSGIIVVEEDVKGKSNLDEIRMNFSTGHYRRESNPQKMTRLLKVGMPIIVFYRQSYRIESLGYVNGTWFQTHSYAGYSDGWWGFTHIDPYMSRTFSGSTTEFQRMVRSILAGKKWVSAPKDAVKVLALTGNSTEPMWSQVPVHTNTVSYEYNTIRSVRKKGKQILSYESTRDRSLPGLDEADILWLGQEEIANHYGYLFDPKTEKKIKQFVKNGGIVVVSGQDSNPDRPCKTDWLVGNLKGVERSPTRDFKITKGGTKLFSKPNQIQPGQLYIDDAWTDWDKNYEIFATANGGKDLVAGTRRYGKGVYVITSLRNDNEGTVTANKKLIENILYYAADVVKAILPQNLALFFNRMINDE